MCQTRQHVELSLECVGEMCIVGQVEKDVCNRGRDGFTARNDDELRIAVQVPLFLLRLAAPVEVGQKK